MESNTNSPEWNEQISFIEQFPPLARRIKIQVLDDANIGEVAVATHFLDLQQISNPNRNGNVLHNTLQHINNMHYSTSFFFVLLQFCCFSFIFSHLIFCLVFLFRLFSLLYPFKFVYPLYFTAFQYMIVSAFKFKFLCNKIIYARISIIRLWKLESYNMVPCF